MHQWLKFWRSLIDLFLPRSALHKTIEEMTSLEFLRRARRSSKADGKNIISLLDYRNPLVRTAIWQVKYRNHQKITQMLAEILYPEILDEITNLSQFANFKEPILVPIPMSGARRKARGYNQTENLAEEIMKIDDGHNLTLMTGVLIKIKETPAQSSLSRTLRLTNLKNCFAVKKTEKILGRNIILLDDVTTTGATLGEASTTLLRAGARKVIAIAVAH